MIGYSTKDPKLRAEELSHTGSPHPYSVEYDILVNEPRDVEQLAHKTLSEQREGKEWFRCGVSQAVQAIRNVVGSNVLLENIRTPLDSTSPDHRSIDLPEWCQYSGCNRPAVRAFSGYYYCSEHYRTVRNPNRDTAIRRLRDELAVELAKRKP